ncbi:hypothetical protein LIER_31926 [Lithospermum erythrorhizon]|uniref:Uncharacterized protein n=1 Tax=Lithospermum erythrorhizon TaxID=34254 RepID=A0AAV3RSG9_LITER
MTEIFTYGGPPSSFCRLRYEPLKLRLPGRLGFLCNAHYPLVCLVIPPTIKIPGQKFSTLRITGPEEDKVTILVAYASLHRGHVAQWPLITKREQEKGHSWSSGHEKAL